MAKRLTNNVLRECARTIGDEDVGEDGDDTPVTVWARGSIVCSPALFNVFKDMAKILDCEFDIRIGGWLQPVFDKYSEEALRV
jgi:hypothetical protein